ncbi:MAG: hypothetical protein LBH75_00030 [Treponema sp.]|nr:hypothetical protein [Treponema sp.]
MPDTFSSRSAGARHIRGGGTGARHFYEEAPDTGFGFTTCASLGYDCRISWLRLVHLSATTPVSRDYDLRISRIRLPHLMVTTCASLGYDSRISWLRLPHLVATTPASRGYDFSIS